MSSVAIRSLPRTPSFSAKSLTLTPSVTVIARVIGTGSCGICAPPKRGGGAKPFIGPSLVLGYCWRPRLCCGPGRCGRAASPGAGINPAAPAPGRGVPNPGRAPNPGRPPGPADPPAGWVRVGCIGRRAPGGPPCGGRGPKPGPPEPGPPPGLPRSKIGRPRCRMPGGVGVGRGATGAGGGGGGAVYTGRGPVCGIMTRRGGGAGLCAGTFCGAAVTLAEAGACSPAEATGVPLDNPADSGTFVTAEVGCGGVAGGAAAAIFTGAAAP